MYTVSQVSGWRVELVLVKYLRITLENWTLPFFLSSAPGRRGRMSYKTISNKESEGNRNTCKQVILSTTLAGIQIVFWESGSVTKKKHYSWKNTLVRQSHSSSEAMAHGADVVQRPSFQSKWYTRERCDQHHVQLPLSSRLSTRWTGHSLSAWDRARHKPTTFRTLA